MRLVEWVSIGQSASRCLAFSGALGTALLLIACEEENTFVPLPLPEVTVAQPVIQDVTEYLEYTGTLVAHAQTEVRARVPGVLESMHFVPGTPVLKGDLLFTIDPDEYDAQVEAAEAELAQAESRQTETAKTLERAKTLFEKGNVSEAKLDEAKADFLSAKAEVLIHRADLTRAQINLGYTEVRAPITGRVGRNLVDVGNLVGDDEATILTDVTAFNPIYVYFEVNELDLLRVMASNDERGSGDAPAGKKRSLPLELGLANEEGYPRVGVTDFADSQVDPDTGTLGVRGVIENPGEQPALLPGLFARVRVPIGNNKNMPLVTERAIGFDQTGQFVLIVNSDRTVEKRNVTLGRISDGLRVITSGVQGNDLVIVKGLQQAREGAEVEAEQIEMATMSTSALEERADHGDNSRDKDMAENEGLSEETASRAEAENQSKSPSSAESSTAASDEAGVDTSETEPTTD